MVISHVDKRKHKTSLLSDRTNHLLPFSGDIVIQDIKEPFVYINGDAYKVENGKKNITVQDMNLEIEVDHVKYDVHVLCTKWSKEMLFDYIVFGKAFKNNLVNDSVDEEILFDAIENMDEEELHLSLCTFNRKFDNITKQQDVEAVLKCTERLPYIFYKPKQHLKQVNEIRPAAVVSRIGQESISHLASHSEHWKGIKANGLIPERLLARVLEDDIAIYENIAVKTLVDKLYIKEKKLNEENMDCEMQIQVDDGHSVSSEQKSYYHARDALMKGLDDEEIEYRQALLEEQREQIERILELLGQCKSTQLYRKLKKQKPIKGKLKKTNIFMMDKYYKHAYKLWNMIETPSEVSVFDELEDLDGEYQLFCKTLFLFALRYFNFAADMPEKNLFVKDKLQSVTYNFKDWNVLVKNVDSATELEDAFEVKIYLIQKIVVDVSEFGIPYGTVENGHNNIQYENGEFIFDSPLDDSEQERLIEEIKPCWPKNQQRKNGTELKAKLYATFFNYKEKSRTILFVPWKYCFVDNVEEIKITLNKLKSKIPQQGYDESYIITISRPNELSAVEDSSVLNSMLNYGAANKEKLLEATKIGVIPISMSDINSYRRFTKILLKQMVSLDSERKICPICGEGMWKNRSSNNISECRNCGFTIIDTQCPECKEKYAFTRYSIPKLNQINADHPGFKVLMNENKLAYKNITEAYIEENQVNPVCPSCGH